MSAGKRSGVNCTRPKRQIERLRDARDEQRLRETRDADEQRVAARKQRDEQRVDDRFLADDGSRNLLLEPLAGLLAADE